MENNRVHRDQTPAASAEVNVRNRQSAGPADREETAVAITASNNASTVIRGRSSKKVIISHEHYFTMLAEDTLRVLSFPTTHCRTKFSWCSLCQMKSSERKCCSSRETYGFLTDYCDSEDQPILKHTCDLFMEVFWLTYGCPDVITYLHHINCAVFCATQDSLNLSLYGAQQELQLFKRAWEAKNAVPLVGGLPGGTGEEKKNEEPEADVKDVKYRKNREARNNKRQQKQQDKPGKGPKNAKQNKAARGKAPTRSNKNKAVVVEQVADLVAQVKGQNDARVEREVEEKELEKEKQKEEKCETKRLELAAYGRGASTPVNFSCRPAMNFGFQYKGMSSYGRDTSRQYFYGTAGFMLASVFAPFLLPLSIKLFSLQFERVTLKLPHSVRTVSHEEASLKNARGEDVDARPSETKIGDGELAQVVSTAELEFPARVVAVPDFRLEDDNDTTVHFVHDDKPLKRAAARLCTVASHLQRVFQGARYYFNQGNTLFTSLVASAVEYSSFVQRNNPQVEQVEDNALSAPAADIDREARFVDNLTEPWFKGPNTFVAKCVDGHSVINAQGTVITLYNFMLLGCKALYNDRSPVYFSSCTAKQVEKPLAERVKDAHVYDYLVTRADYCAHSYHNASTYGAMSSQISPDVNFSMIYRKLSRYTSINQNRFGSKDLLCNAEQIARLQYWAVREAPVARNSRLHF